MKRIYFTKKGETFAVNTVWFLSFFLIFISMFNPYLFMDCKHLKAGLKHLKKGAYKDIPTQNQKININSVSEKELIQLKGVGPKLSKRIIEYRIEHGSFSSVDELLKVKGIGEKKLSKIKKLLNV